MHLVSLSRPHNVAFVIELSQSLEFEHEVRREVTFQVMRWFVQVDDADERWTMDVEKVVRQVSLGISASVQGWFRALFFFPPSFLV
jgi:sister chromatid cohesion protein DCC1